MTASSVINLSQKMNKETLHKLSIINKLPTNSNNEPETDSNMILAHIIACLNLEVISRDDSFVEKELNLTFPDWLINGPYHTNTVNQLTNLIKAEIQSKFEQNDIEEFIKIIFEFQKENIDTLYQKYEILNKQNTQKDTPHIQYKIILQKVINDIQTDLVKNPDTGEKKLQITFPQWFTHGSYPQHVKTSIIKEITQATQEHLKDEYD